MSLYGMIHGTNPLAGLLLSILNIDPRTVSRFRDCYLAPSAPREEGQPLQIHIYTRMGGSNRGHDTWADADAQDQQVEGPDCACASCVLEYGLTKHPEYIRDFDDDHDCTYATYEFNVPNAFRDDLEKLVGLNPDAIPEPPSVRFKAFLEKMSTSGNEDPDVRRVADAMAPLFEQIKKVT